MQRCMFSRTFSILSSSSGVVVVVAAVDDSCGARSVAVGDGVGASMRPSAGLFIRGTPVSSLCV